MGPAWQVLLTALFSIASASPDVGTVERLVAGCGLFVVMCVSPGRRGLALVGVALGLVGALRLHDGIERAAPWADVTTTCLVRFEERIEDARWRVRLGHPAAGQVAAQLRKAPVGASVGDVWRLRIDTSALPRVRNPDDRRALRSALSRGAVVRARALDDGVLVRPGEGIGVAARVRDAAVSRWRSRLGPAAGLWRALLLADRAGLPDEATERVQRLGFAHLLALSGLHVGVVVGLFAWLLSRWSRNAMLLVLPALVGWAVLAGGGVSMVRAVLMVAGVVIGHRLRRHVRLTEVIACCALVEIGVRPEVLGGIGWWLSYGATLAILRSLPWMRGRSYVLQGLAVSCVAQAGTFAWIVDAFGRVPLLSPLVLLVVGPLFSVVLAVGGAATLLASLGIPGAAGVAIVGAHAFGLSMTVFGWTGRWAFAHPGFDDGSWALSMSLLAVWLVPMEGRHRRWLPVLTVVAVVAVHLPLWTGGRDHVWTSFDVGQGDGGIYRCGDRTVVVDTGPGTQTWRPFEHSMLPFVQRRDLDDLIVVLTHRHQDHVAGTRRLLRTGRVGTLCMARSDRDEEWARAFAAEAVDQGASVRWLARGDVLWDDCCRADVLWPPRDAKVLSTLHDANDRSVVLALGPRAHPLLATGDLERTGERAVVEALRGTAPGWILKVAHHGGDTGTDDALLDVLRPTWGLLSCGHDNRYGHPKPAVVERLDRAGVEVLRTDQVGAITVRWGRRGVRIDTAGGGP